MTTTWMNELVPTELTGTDTINRNRLSCRQTRNCDRASEVEHDADRLRQVLQVLVVDDDRDASDGLAALVRRWGHDAHAVRDRIAALRTAAALQPDVVLLDIELPRLGGCHAVRRLRRDLASPDCLIVALTGHADREHRRQCSEAGIDVVLVKPVDPAVVETLLLLECTRVNRLKTVMRHSPWF